MFASHNVEFKNVPGAPPDLVLLNEDGEVLEVMPRISLFLFFCVHKCVCVCVCVCLICLHAMYFACTWIFFSPPPPIYLSLSSSPLCLLNTKK